jgi:hypothetical protein
MDNTTGLEIQEPATSRAGSDEVRMGHEDKARFLTIALTGMVALVGLIGYQYVQLPMPVGEAIEAYQRGDRWRLMLAPASGVAVPLGRYADKEGCEGARQAYVRQAVEEGRSVSRLTCERTQVWWIRTVAWLGAQKRGVMPPKEE